MPTSAGFGNLILLQPMVFQMDEKEIAEFRRILEAQQAELRDISQASAKGRSPVILDQQSVGRISRVDAMQQQAMAQAQERQRVFELVRIEQALKRIEEGEFGWCMDCGEAIAPGRLKIAPSAGLCVRCAGR